MAEFKNVTVIKKGNVYFDGNVTSRSIIFADGSRKTLGVMLPGEYEFNTSEKEIMEILAGDLDVLLPGTVEWRAVRDGETFEVAANSSFKLRGQDTHRLLLLVCQINSVLPVFIFRRRTEAGVTSTSSSSVIYSIACSRLN